MKSEPEGAKERKWSSFAEWSLRPQVLEMGKRILTDALVGVCRVKELQTQEIQLNQNDFPKR